MGIRQVPGSVLRNKGIPVELYVLARDEAGEPIRPYQRVTNQADEPVTSEVWLQMTNLALADIEEQYGSLGDWQRALASKPYSTLINSLAICLGEERRAVGVRMVDGKLEDYSTAVGGAFMLANGVDGDRVGEVLARGVRAATEQRQRLIDRNIEAMLADAPTADQPSSRTPGTNGSEAGSEPVTASTSSGGRRQRRSPSS